jgi:hypothetical protein
MRILVVDVGDRGAFGGDFRIRQPQGWKPWR